MKQINLLRNMILIVLLFHLSIPGLTQDFPVRGTVLGPDGQALSGVTVGIKGSTRATQTDGDGNFQINAPSSKSVLIFSYVGFSEQQMALNNRSQLTIGMTHQENSLESVVVVGYGTKKKSDITGALSRITADELQERPTTNVLQAIQGKAAGVQVTSNIKPGELPVVRVRGNRSLGASNEPLYVVDGIPIINALGVSSFSVNDLNPNDIVSMEILKDASATAIYGSRGANGVVLITTNKGKQGRATLGVTSTVSADWYKSLTDWMDGGQYIDRWRLALINGRQYQSVSGTPNFNNPATSWYPDPFLDRDRMNLGSDQVALASVWQGYEWDVYGVTPRMRPTTADEVALGWPAMVPVYNSANVRSYDWLDAATRTGVTQNYQLSLSAGNEISRLATSLGFFNQLGNQRDQDFKRYTVNISGDISPNKWFTLGTSVIGSFSMQNYGIQPPNTSNTGSKDLYSRATDQFPYALPTDSTGAFILNAGGNLNLFNPLIDVDQSLNERRTTSILASIYAELKFTPWLKYRVNFGPQYRHFRGGTWTGPNATSHLTNRPNTASYGTQENFSWVVENLLFVDKTFGEKHDIGLTLLQSSQKSRRENASISVSGLINPLSLWYDLASNTAGNPGYGSDFTENTLTSFMARVNYTFNNKYLLTVSGRADGASVLAPGHKWDFFPSAALAWKMQEEAFMDGIDWITELKPRVSYGITGNSSVNPYTTSGPLSRNPYLFGGAAAIGYLPQLVQNPDLGWEQTSQVNIGLDFTLFRNRLSGSLELYSQNTTDLILPKTLPAVSGYVQKFENVGATRNKGIEITVSATPVKMGDFEWVADVNWSRNKEEIVELLNGKQDMVGSGFFIGHPTQVYRQYDNAGIWGNTAKDLEEMAKFNANGHRFYPGTIRVVDVDGNYRIDGNDLVIRGTPRPKWSGGITNTFSYKNWSLSSFIYFRWGQTYFGGFPGAINGGANPNGRVENSLWSFEKQSGIWPMPNTGNVENITAALQYNDGSFGVVRHISLSYDFPRSLIQSLTLKNLVVNVQILNPFIFGPDVVKWGLNPDDDTNWDRASSNTNPLGGTNNNTILPQSFVIGLRAGF